MSKKSPNFELFHPPRSRNSTRVSINVKGYFEITPAALRLLGDAKHVSLHFDPERLLCGVKATDKPDPDSYALTPTQRRGKVSAIKFCKHYGISLGHRYICWMEGDILAFGPVQMEEAAV